MKLGIISQVSGIVYSFRGSKHRQKEAVFLRPIIAKGDLVFDVGANRGQSAESFLRAGARVVSFEPQKELHSEIKQFCRNLGDLRIDSDALGSKAETKEFFKKNYDQTSSFRRDWEGAHIDTEIVSLSTLDLKISQYGCPKYCKIDVEGWELEVLLGLSQAIPIISFEYHLRNSEINIAYQVIQRITQIGQYDFNIRLPWQPEFLMEKNMPCERFYELFPNDLKIPERHGYGDIFCFLRAELNATPLR